MSEEKLNFVTIEVSKKQIDMRNPVHNDKTNKDYVRIFAPEGGVFFYPLQSLKVYDDKPDRVFFSRPEGTELQVRFSRKKENVPDSAPDSEKYENYVKVIKIEDLKEMYADSKKKYMDEQGLGFVNMTVPTEWGEHFTSENGVNLVSISIPIKENGKDVYYSFIVEESKFRESEKTEGMSYFGFPKKYRGTTSNPIEPVDYVIPLKTRVLQMDNTYKNEYKEISSEELKKHVDAAVERYRTRDLFVGVEISEKLVREFSSKDGKALAAVLVPVYENKEDEKATFYEIVVPAARIKETDKGGIKWLSMFKNGTDENPYEHTAKRNVLKEGTTDEYETISLKMTSQEVVNHFNLSSQRFKENRTENRSSHSLADELDGTYPLNEENNMNEENTLQRRRGR